MNDAVTSIIANDAADVAEKACQLLLLSAQQAIEKNGRFVLVLAGGNTPQNLYQLLANQDQDWEKWFLVYGDERCLPSHNADRNSVMVEETWLSKINFPEKNHFMLGDFANVDAAAREYGQRIEHLLPADFALLGIGEDGHTASLFPQNMAMDLTNNATAIAVCHSPKPPSERVSLSYACLNQASVVCFMASGANKQFILQQFQKNPLLPMNRIRGSEKTYLIRD